MNDFSIKISISRLSLYSISKGNKFDSETLDLIVESFSSYIRELYGLLILEAINSPRYKGEWEPEGPEYLEYLGVKKKSDLITLISESLSVKKVGHNYVVGFDPKDEYPRSHLSVLQVLRALEYGTTLFPARPILMKIIRNINISLYSLWTGFLTMKGVI